MTPQTLRIIRLALLMGILVFGGVCWYLTSTGQFESSLDEDTLGVFQIVFGVLLVAEGGVLFWAQQQWKQAETFQQKATFNIVGWALGEGLALFGAVILLISGGHSLLFLGGLLFFALAWLLFPIPDPERINQ